ncbi:hypothetical protein OIE66_01305 [Nonomuraea sp. NBC_01738]|uniref:hypothetical protein n=1 Tax=Nonomuraea sp. NBC_01738 TaxID=2976003 RepID=UPI002E1368BC|nr:hypothetical protein OIE66_01305 [Nonomuraea sp. NBC_01738]
MRDPIWKAWKSAVELWQHLVMTKGELTEIQQPPVNLGPRKHYANLHLGYARWYGPPGQSSLFALAQAQWRDHQVSQVLVTDQELVTFAYHQAQLWSYDRILTVQPFVHEQALVLTFREGHEPLRLDGPWTLWLSIMLTYLVFGREMLRRPEFTDLDRHLLHLRARALPPGPH